MTIVLNGTTGITDVDGSAAAPAITGTDTNTGIFFPAADTIAFSEGGAEAMRIDSAGNVGIGTSSPSAKLNVISGSVAQLIIGFSGTSASYLDSNLIVFRSAATTERMRIDSSGNVLIGTTTAQTGAVLAVTGGIQGTIKSGTAVASTSGTSIDFTSIPSWVKRITVMFNGTSLSSTADILVQLGTGSTTFTTSGYNSTAAMITGGGNSISTSTAGFVVRVALAAGVNSGNMIINNVSGNIWVAGANVKRESTGVGFGAGEVTLSAVLTAVRITTTSTDTFDAGSINILYEG